MIHRRTLSIRCLVPAALIVLWATPHSLPAQNVFQFHRADQPPGSVGQGQLMRGGPLAGYYQPVEFVAPAGSQVTLLQAQGFADERSTPFQAGLLIGAVYRLRVTGIPQYPGEEIYPTVELVNRLYPPPGLATRFPVPIHLTQEELELALQGRFVTRVVYLEDPNNALPVTEQRDFQRYFDVGQQRDPLQVADQLGRPLAIIRMGSRVPEADESGSFYYHSPPWVELPPIEPLPAASGGDDPALQTRRPAPIERFGRDVPRILR